MYFLKKQMNSMEDYMKINKLIDHTYLKAFGTKKEIDKLLQEAKENDFKSVCINPTFVKYCSEQLVGTDVLVCTVIGFPLGANTIETKVFETLNAISNGANEIDMVINIGQFKAGNYAYTENEINQVCEAAMNNTVKVIVEICYLTDAEIKKAAEIVAKTNAKFIKTSTGFGTGGATPEAVKIMKDNVGGKEVKAAGGVRSKADLDEMVKNGATRIGTSNGVIIMNEKDKKPLYKDIKMLEKLLERKKQVILYGPPGTGKTFKAREFIKSKGIPKYTFSKDTLSEYSFFSVTIYEPRDSRIRNVSALSRGCCPWSISRLKTSSTLVRLKSPASIKVLAFQL